MNITRKKRNHMIIKNDFIAKTMFKLHKCHIYDNIKIYKKLLNYPCKLRY